MPNPIHRRARAALAATLLAACALPALAVLNPAEKAVLVELYTSTNGPGWTNKTGWENHATTDPCVDGWHGVVCGATDATGQRVTALNLSSNRLTGTLPSLAALTVLELFRVQDNQLTGNLPALSGLTALRVFQVDHNQIGGPIPSLAGLTALETFHAHSNQLTGTIPPLAGLTALEYFRVDRNQLIGSMPAISGLAQLEEFFVNNNQLTGTIPSLAGLPSLRQLNIHDNQLTGAIPDLGGTALQGFYADNNQLTGTPPAAPASLIPGNSDLCPNYLRAPSPTDAAWDTATFGPEPWSFGCTAGYLVSPSAGPGGSVGPARGVAAGGTAAIAITPAAGHVVDAVASSCGGTLAGGSFTTGPVHADCTVAVTFRAAVAATPVPALGAWTLAALGLLLAGLGRRLLPRD